MSEQLEHVRHTLREHRQEHLLAFYDELDAPRQRSLLDELEQVDFEELDDLIENLVREDAGFELPPDLAPAPFYPREAGNEDRPYDADHYRAAGERLIRAGKIAAFTVAGGQGTRLGWNGPKGSYPGTVVTGKPLFRVFAEQLLAVQRKYGVTIPWYIMTSRLNDADTRAFLLDNNCFGLRRQDIFLFPQGMMPSIDRQSTKVLLAEKHAVALNPDGHGGCIKALYASGALEDMTSRHIEIISYFQVDNPLVTVVDPLFIGLHAEAPDSSGEMSSKMVQKAYPEEKVGVFCTSGGRTIVVEYSDLPQELAHQGDKRGTLRFQAGSIAIHLINVDFVRRLNEEQDLALPFHRAVKKVAFVDPESGRKIDPDEPNAVKFEKFVFDALPRAKSSIVYETDRVKEFAPIKNAKGVDSPATSHRLQSDRAARWLEAHGVKVPWNEDGHVEARIEISPLTATGPADLVAIDLPDQINAGDEIVL